MRSKFIVFFFGVLLGCVPMYLENQRVKQTYQEARQDLMIRSDKAEKQLSDAQEKLRIALLRDQLGSLILEVKHDNFGVARVRSTNFFNQLRDTLPEVEKPEVQQSMRKVLDRRDEITAALVATDSHVSSQLQQIYDEFPQAATVDANSTSQQAVAQKPADVQARVSPDAPKQ